MAKRLMKYNPSFLTEEELLNTFVVRHADFELIMQVVRENTGSSNQHVLVIGPRGSGKTTLVHRVAVEVERNEKLREHWHPLIFSEESYEVVSAGEFWLEALLHLSEQAGDEKWKRTYIELKNESDDQRLGERSLAQLLDFADSQGKRILLIVENLNMLFSDLTSEEEAWKIRHTLINESRLMLLATATNRFENIENSSHAMFEMFKMQELKPLDDNECNSIWELITGQRLMGERIRPVRILTGGNPRLLTIIAKFSAHRSFRKLLDDLVDLIDDHTEYFKSHLDNLPAIERKVYLALAGLWDASTARDIAKAARLDVNKTSSLLNRLVGRGAVVVEEQGKKIKWYVVAERMYNIYYLMRRRGKPADRVKATVKFMVSMYDPVDAARLITEEASRLSPEFWRDHCIAYEETLKEVRDSNLIGKIIDSTPKSFLESPYVSETLRNFTAMDKKIEKEEDLSDKEKVELKEARELNNQGVKFGMDGNLEQAISIFDAVIAKFVSADNLCFLYEAVNALVNKSVALYNLGRFEEAIKVCEEIVERFGDRKEAAFLEGVARALIGKAITFSILDRFEEAVKVYEDIIERFDNAKEAMIVKHVTAAMVNKGVSLSELNRRDDAIKVYDKVVALYKDRSEPQIAEYVSMAMFNKGYSLGILNRLEEAIQVYDEVVVLYKERTEPQIAGHVTASIVNKGLALITLGKGNEALDAAKNCVQDVAFDEKIIEGTIALFIDLAASGYAKEALGILVNSPAEKHLEPLVVGLKLYIGEDVKTAVEILEVAKDVVKRIEERKQKRKQGEK